VTFITISASWNVSSSNQQLRTTDLVLPPDYIPNHHLPIINQLPNPATWTGTQSYHLCPIFSLCFSRARSTSSGDVNWTNPSPAARPWPSFTMIIPLGAIGSPVTTNHQPTNTPKWAVTVSPRTQSINQSINHTL